jgi:hypothetical protein
MVKAIPPPSNGLLDRMIEGSTDVNGNLPKVFGVYAFDGFGDPPDVLGLPTKLYVFELRDVGKIEWKRRGRCP